MMIEYAKYPDGMPLPSANFGGKYKTPTETTRFSSGKIRRRKTGRTSVKSATLEWLFTPEEFDIWEVFYRAELDDGCGAFRIEMCTGGNSQTGEHVVQCVDDYSFSHEECSWRVSVECIIFPYPSTDEGDLLESYMGEKITDILSTINRYYEKGYQ